MRKFWIIFVALLTVSLTSCGTFAQIPPEEAIRIAVTQQLTQVQDAIAQDLGISTPITSSFKVKEITINQRQKVNDPLFSSTGYPDDIYRVSGTVETTLVTEREKTEQTAPFEVYLGTTPSDTAEEKNKSADIETWYIVPNPNAQT